ncbi:MAG: hypothetical protein Q7Q71_09755 [Verrucomicrobiota bacterium JB023]|nr:hypothetical protein [Verrucomicrobiota bacterium JB023]
MNNTIKLAIVSILALIGLACCSPGPSTQAPSPVAPVGSLPTGSYITPAK